MKIKSMIVFFDVGHTLVQGLEPSARRRLASCLQLSEKETKRAGRLIMVHPATDPGALARALQEVLPAHSLKQISGTIEDLWEEQRRTVSAIPEAVPVLKSLKAMGIRLGIASNTWHPFYLGFTKALEEVLDLFDCSLLSYRLGCKKPSGQFYHHISSQAGVADNECWMVGDAYHHDIEPALRQGMRTIWLMKHPEREKTAIAEMLRGSKPRPHWVVEKLTEVVPFFQPRETTT